MSFARPFLGRGACRRVFKVAPTTGKIPTGRRGDFLLALTVRFVI
jgi:hypothetical protein